MARSRSIGTLQVSLDFETGCSMALHHPDPITSQIRDIQCPRRSLDGYEKLLYQLSPGSNQRKPTLMGVRRVLSFRVWWCLALIHVRKGQRLILRIKGELMGSGVD